VGITASKDRPGDGAIALYVEPASISSMASPIPSFIGGVPTSVRAAVAPNSDPTAMLAATQPRAASLAQALTVKQRIVASLLRSNPAIFGVGVGQSLDNPSDAALMLFVDRRKFSGNLPESLDMIGGVRVRIVLMDRLHVTRSHGAPARSASSCLASQRPAADSEETLDPPAQSGESSDPLLLPLQNRIKLPE
jgi:hypothetical protein